MILLVTFNTTVTHIIVIPESAGIELHFTASIQITLDFKKCLKEGFQARSYREIPGCSWKKSTRHSCDNTFSHVLRNMYCCDAVELLLSRVRLRQSNNKQNTNK